MALKILRAVLLLAIALVFAPRLRTDEAADQYAVAAGHYAAARWELAVEGFQALIKDHPNDPQSVKSLFFLGEALVQLRRYDEAAADFHEFLQRDPGSVFARQALFRAGESALLGGKRTAARRTFADFRIKYPDDKLNAFVLMYLGQIALADNDAATAQAMFGEALRRFPAAAPRDEIRFGLARTPNSKGIGRPPKRSTPNSPRRPIRRSPNRPNCGSPRCNGKRRTTPRPPQPLRLSRNGIRGAARSPRLDSGGRKPCCDSDGQTRPARCSTRCSAIRNSASRPDTGSVWSRKRNRIGPRPPRPSPNFSTLIRGMRWRRGSAIIWPTLSITPEISRARSKRSKRLRSQRPHRLRREQTMAIRQPSPPAISSRWPIKEPSPMPARWPC